MENNIINTLTILELDKGDIFRFENTTTRYEIKDIRLPHYKLRNIETKKYTSFNSKSTVLNDYSSKVQLNHLFVTNVIKWNGK